MKNDKSILKEALADYESLKEASDKNAKNKLAEEFSGRFNELIKEEIHKNKKPTKESETSDNVENIKESVNSDNDKTKNSVMKKETDGTKEKTKVTDRKVISEGAYETERNDNGDYTVDREETDPYMTMEEIDKELSSFDDDLSNVDVDSDVDTGEVDGEVEGGENIEQELKELRDRLDIIIGSLSGSDDNAGEVDDLGAEDGEKVADGEFDVSELNLSDDNFEDDTNLPSDDEIDEILKFDNEPEVDEGHGLSYSARRNNTGRHLPSYDNLSTGEQDQSPNYVKESKIKLKALIKENKELTKKLNDAKKLSESATSLIDQYKTALSKYRVQLKEMAVFNTNLAHVNNILINEELALTQQDKIKIINDFKGIDDITESQKKYKSVLAEMKNPKKLVSESFEDRLSASITPSSKQKLDEVVERTSYTNDDHLAKILKNIDYVENRGRK
jgi:hypothetical protein